MPIFTVSPADITGTSARIKGAEAHHLARVHRIELGQIISVTDSQGGLFTGRVASIGSEVILKDLGKIETQPPYPIHLFVSLLKKDKMEWIVEKATELNVTAVYWVQTKYSVRTELSDEKWNRFQKISQAAQKQCGRAWPLEINRVRTLRDLIEDQKFANFSHLFFTEKKGAARLKKFFETQTVSPPYALWIGPEGGWDEEEIRHAGDRGYHFVTLGPLILRAETAAICAMSSVIAMTF